MQHHQPRIVWTHRRSTRIAGATLAVLSWVVLPAAGQSTSADPSSQVAADHSVVITQRPLRTFRGDAVRVSSGSSRDLEIGVIRPIRKNVGVRRNHIGYGFSNSYNRRYIGPNDVEIGVVRPFRQYTPVVRHAPSTITNDRATRRPAESAPQVQTPAYDVRPVTVGPEFPTAREGQVISTPSPAVEVDANDPWSLLNAGRYREARQQFGWGEGEDARATQIGRALAAALSGDLAAGAEMLPDDPALPAGMTLSDTAKQRIQLTAEFLYDGQPATQAKLRELLRAADMAN